MKRFILILSALAGLLTQGFAAQTPQSGRLDQRVTHVTYQANNVVKVRAAYGISTMIIFDESEKFQTLSLGDTESWQIVPAAAGNILFVKPIARDVPTNLNIVTDKRIYFLELVDQAPGNGDVFGIQFNYPENALNDALREEATIRAANPAISNIDKANLNINYSFSGQDALKPVEVFDDGKMTFFRFAGRMPAIFKVNLDFTESLVNFRREGEYIVVDGTAAQFTLREGDLWTCIFNLRVPDISAPDPYINAPVLDTTATTRSGSNN
jgi:type IV secretion system protein VirB9